MHTQYYTRWRMTFILAMVLACLYGRAQTLPAGYNQLKDDHARMRFIIQTINDSLRGDNLEHVLDWAKQGYALAEKNKVDSLQGSFLMYIGKAYYFYYEKVDSAIYFYKKSLPFFSNKVNADYAISMRSIMDSYAELGEKDSCFKYIDSSLAIMNALPDTSYVKARLAEVIGTNYSWFGMYNSAIRLYDFARNNYMNRQNYQGVGMVLSHIALIYDETEDDAKAITYWRESLPYLEKFPRPYTTNCSNIASSYYDLGQLDSAMYYVLLSEPVAAQAKMMNQLMINNKIRGAIFVARGNYEMGRTELYKCLSFFEKNNDPRNIILTLFAISNLDSATGSLAAATQHLRRALELSRQSGFQSMEMKALMGLGDLSIKKGNYKEAYDYQARYMALSDSANKAKMATDLADFEVLYKTQQKEQEILLLKKDNDINKLQLKNNRQLLYFSIGGFLLLILALSIIFYQLNRRNKLNAEKMKAELQTQVLRSQMNPHFIFNCLNSIENFVMLNDKRRASDYLNKFSRLIRSILDSTRDEVVPLAKDMEALNLYVELEQLRFDHKFNFKTHVDPVLASGDYQVPALLIQPYVENAILHGLANSDDSNLHLTVTASLDNDTIRYVIQDNGVGRIKASEYNNHNKPHHKSVGLKIAEQRIHVFNGEKKYDPVRITDLYDHERHADGTRVEITIKAL